VTERDDFAPFQWGLTPSAAPHSDPVAPHTPPMDDEIPGVTETIHAHPIGLPDPVDEGLAPSDIDSLFGDTQFREYAEVPIVTPLAVRPSNEVARRPASELVRVEARPRARRAREPLGSTQKTLLWVAGSLLAALALVGLFALGLQLSSVIGPAPAVVAEPTPTPSAASDALGIGPVLPGEYRWDELLGGECLQPFESAWQDRYTVVGCTDPHAAQLVYRGLFADPLDAAFPGVDALQQRIGLHCTAPSAIDYAAAAAITDVQVSTSFAPDEAEWASGNRSFFCFVSRASAQPFTTSIATPQTGPAVPVPAPTPVP
jgi:hypothetical protein